MSSGTVRIVHWDAAVRRRWRFALGALAAGVCESASLDAAPAGGGEIVVMGDPGGGACAALRSIEDHRLENPVVLVVAAADSSEELAISALKLGVKAYVRDPLTLDTLHEVIAKLIERDPPAALRDAGMVGASEAIERVRRQIQLAAKVDSTVLITGESGTGKEVTARALHAWSGRPGRLVPLNCAAIPETLLESELFGYERGAFTGAYKAEDGKLAQADGGTLFLDEIGELSPAAQSKLLRAIEIKEVQRLGSSKISRVNVRVVAATNRRLEALVADGRFREDLYYRLNVVQIQIPPLRDRICDLPALVSHCLGELNARFHQDVKGVDHPVQLSLARYRWPGNIRELKNLLEAACVAMPGPTIGFRHLPEHYQQRLTELAEAPAAVSERHRLLNALNATQWNKSKAAEQLQWSRVTLYRKLAKYGIGDATEA